MTNLISWQKWLDPFGSDDAEELEHDPYLADYEEDESDEENTKRQFSEKFRIR